MAHSALTGLKILIVEDSYLIAEHLTGVLRQHECEVLGPVPRLNEAMALVEHGALPDCAMLDVNLSGELCFPIARALADRDVPFIILTGYDDRAVIPSDVYPVAVLGKPLDEATMLGVIASAVGRGKGASRIV